MSLQGLELQHFSARTPSAISLKSINPLAIYVHPIDDPYGKPMRKPKPEALEPQSRYMCPPDIDNSIAWAFCIVHDLGYFNQPDKVALVNNPIHVDMSPRVVDLPAVPLPNTDPRVIAANVIEIIKYLT
ncbi:hypothetical protein PLEOSDRAFT_1107781 [Pleurotus ostreatus PC15]|uniref:Uncharacterized protein n=1 Tax=Pleurotus ostreatus (strain PC15) TaxID=1137138 RepID=A0A067ND44_PLEO1|nr:hypothetical protein PLEOSDRAFT_1107781 [Pleurotus ostreatus PC15]